MTSNTKMAHPIRIGLVLFDVVEELDFAGPWEVFTMAAQLKPGSVEPVLISETGARVVCAKGMRVECDHSFANVGKLDVLLVPGGMGTRVQVKNPAMLTFIAEAAKDCAWVTSVCTGSLLLTAAGPARGRTVTTHWGFIETLRERGEAKQVLEKVRYVQDGHVVTSAGVSAGIDMALWLVGQWFDPQFARQVQHAMEYDPAPPYADIPLAALA
jgi:transcriptional regulator GlxA family with amidase domain